MSWLVRGEEVLASLEIAEGHAARGRGLLGRDGLDGALLIPKCRSIHTIGMKFDVDVAFLDADMRVVRVVLVRRRRITRPVWSARSVLEAEAGSFREWGLEIGDELGVK